MGSRSLLLLKFSLHSRYLLSFKEKKIGKNAVFVVTRKIRFVTSSSEGHRTKKKQPFQLLVSMSWEATGSHYISVRYIPLALHPDDLILAAEDKPGLVPKEKKNSCWRFSVSDVHAISSFAPTLFLLLFTFSSFTGWNGSALLKRILPFTSYSPLLFLSSATVGQLATLTSSSQHVLSTFKSGMGFCFFMLRKRHSGGIDVPYPALFALRLFWSSEAHSALYARYRWSKRSLAVRGLSHCRAY